MHIYLNTFPWPITLCSYGYRNVTRSKVTGHVLVNALHAYHRFNRRYHVQKNAKQYALLLMNRAAHNRKYQDGMKIATDFRNDNVTT